MPARVGAIAVEPNPWSDPIGMSCGAGLAPRMAAAAPMSSYLDAIPWIPAMTLRAPAAKTISTRRAMHSCRRLTSPAPTS
jgi:hypothetical protein